MREKNEEAAPIADSRLNAEKFAALTAIALYFRPIVFPKVIYQ